MSLRIVDEPNQAERDEYLIRKISVRACTENTAVNPEELIGYLTCAHKTHELRLYDLLNAPNFDFFHDVFEIAQRINLNTGEYSDMFWPRYAAKQ